ncbi:MAG TPA: SDR family NAD(P)-dependent oxidoreductase, partial [Anaerolineae bacterium]
MKTFITGGVGFIGCNMAARFLKRGDQVTVYDNLSRPRTDNNLKWLRQQFGDDRLRLVQADVRDFETLKQALNAAEPDLLVHLASQVAVTTSVKNPREDFEINALGTFNVLEAARAQRTPPAVFFASTNKVYGGMEDVAVVQDQTRYRYRDLPQGVSEQQPLDFHSPYGCSKGTGDQYVRDYARIYSMRTVVFRQSCIYGERQFGVEDQGWVAHFVIAAAMNRSINIYGDGKQVRDLLYVQDLINAYDSAWNHLDTASGQVFNVGGGVANTLSIWTEFGPLLEQLAGRKISIKRGDWRPGDQPVFISDNSKAKRVLGWEPLTSVNEGVRKL